MKQRYKPERTDLPTPALALVPPVGAAEPQGAPAYVTKTLAEQGPNLPVGVETPDGRVTTFRVRPFKMKQEKLLAQMRDEQKSASIGTFVANTLAMMIQTVGPHNFDAMKDGERQLVINRLTMPDTLYLYLYLRYDALGADEPVVMLVRCPTCKAEFKWYGDLGSMDVKAVADNRVDLTRTYTLRDPMQFRGKEVKAVKLGMLQWGALSRPEFQDRASAQDATITASIIGMEGIDAIPGTFQIGSNELDDMTKFDMAGLVRDIEEHTPGPQLDITPECPACKNSHKLMLDWSWNSFFARSPRPSHSMS